MDNSETFTKFEGQGVRGFTSISTWVPKQTSSTFKSLYFVNLLTKPVLLRYMHNRHQ